MVGLKALVIGLAATHFLWSLSLLLEPSRYVFKPVIPSLFALIHMSVSLLLAVGYVREGAVAGSILLAYYWFFVKPMEPIAEPQTVGILAITLALLSRPLLKPYGNMSSGVEDVLIRLGLAYPFVEWGLDALRNPVHFKSYLSINPLTRSLIPAGLLDHAVLSLAAVELSLAFLVLSGLFKRWTCMMVVAVLVVFAVVAGYPLALPQNIALASAAYSRLRVTFLPSQLPRRFFYRQT